MDSCASPPTEDDETVHWRFDLQWFLVRDNVVCLVCSLSLADTTRLQTLVQILASEMSSDLSDCGHQYAMTHAASTLQSCSAARELMSGLTQVRTSHGNHCNFYTSIAAGVGRAISRVCLFVRVLTGKRLELSTPYLVLVYSIAVAWHARSQRSKGQGHMVRKSSRRTVAIDYSGCPITLCCVTCGRWWHGSAC